MPKKKTASMYGELPYHVEPMLKELEHLKNGEVKETTIEPAKVGDLFDVPCGRAEVVEVLDDGRLKIVYLPSRKISMYYWRKNIANTLVHAGIR